MTTEVLRRPGIDVVPAIFATLTVLAQVTYPLVHGAAREHLTMVTVLLFGAAALSHAALTRGRRTALATLIATAGLGFAAEVLGVHAGVPFGRYAYADALGVRLLSVPVVIALAWTMLAWPAALVARRLVRSFPARVIIGSWALASWDLFLDPQMVAAGQWRWRFPAPHLPGVTHVPLTNYLGWLAVSFAVSLALQIMLRSTPDADDRVPYALYLWTWASSTVALAAFLHLGAAAAWGAVGMGVVAVPLGWVLWQAR